MARWGIDDITIERATVRVCRELAGDVPSVVLPERVQLHEALQESGADRVRVVDTYIARVRRRLGEDGDAFLACCGECEPEWDAQ